MPTSKLRKLQEATLLVVWLVFLPCSEFTILCHIYLRPKAAVSNLSMYQKDPEGLFKHLLLAATSRLSEGWDGSEGLHF